MDIKSRLSARFISAPVVLVIVLIQWTPEVEGQVQDDRCPDNCVDRTCDNLVNFKCTYGCLDGYYGSRCWTVCPGSCATCARNYNVNQTCDSCNDGYYLYNNSKCLSCPTGCRSCNSDMDCTVCYADYSLTNGQCLTLQCPTGCSSCNSNTDCTACKSDYYLTNYQCKQCPTQCSSSCNTNTPCTACDAGFYLSNSDCLPCGSGCRLCSSNSLCTECNSGYYLSNQQCVQCPTRCAQCSSDSECSECISEYATGDVCENCMDGKYGYRCSSNCRQECKTCTDYNICQTCISDRYNSASVTDCSLTSPACPSNCEMCISETECWTCKEGFYKTGTSKKCTLTCLSNCKTCTDDISCISCKPNFQGDKCDNCSDVSWGTQCDSQCPPNCLDSRCHRDTGYCVDCPTEYTGNDCELCEEGKYGNKCDLNCSQYCINMTCGRDGGHCDGGCINNNFYDETCVSCTPGFYGDTCTDVCPANCLKNICQKASGDCTFGCDEYFAGDQCDTCFNGKYGMNCSLDCSSNCSSAVCKRDGGSCLSCFLGYYGAKCQQKCSTNCKNQTCDQTTGICLHRCNDGYSGDKCCIQNDYCETCYNNTECEVCVSGMYGDYCNMACDGNCNDFGCNKAGTACLQGCMPGFTGITCSEEEMTSPPSSMAPIIGGAVGGAVVLAIIVVVIVVLLRRRGGRIDKEDEFLSGTDPKPQPDVPTKSATLKPLVTQEINVERSKQIDEPDVSFVAEASDEEEKVEAAGDVISDVSGDMYGNIGNIRKRIAVVELEQYVASTPRQDLVAEYKLFPRGLIKQHNDACKPENMKNNRYAQVYPYDENRVKLTGRATDYVNASFINGHNKEMAYIASLGPTWKAMEEFNLFWDMVWQKDVEKIVMVTNLVENTNMKCQQYWPEVTETLTYGNITVMNLHENISAEYTVRNFSVSKGNQKRTVSQVHFTAWPDKGVPDHVTSIVEFHNRVKSLKHELNGPILVHCSAGIGRTGTYIALDILTEEGEATGHVDIYNCVMALRQQRVNMVQTESQYIYLHKAVAHNLTYDSRPIPSAEFQKVTADISDEEFETKFERLKRSMEEMTEEENKSKKKSKSFKDLNRSGTDIPGQRYRPLLFKYQSPEDHNYINAVYINSFKARNNFLAAQTPLPATVVDFIKLILQENCTCVVNLEPETLKTKTLGEYLPPDNQTVTHGQFQLCSTKLISPDAYTVRQVTVVEKDKNDAEETVVYCFQFNAWPGKENVPKDPSTFLRFIKDVKDKAKEMMKNEDDTRPILIHCLSGAIKCGLFLAVHNAVEKMENEQEVSIENIMRQIKLRRRSAFPNKDQLVFCYQAVCAYMDMFNTYSNFDLHL